MPKPRRMPKSKCRHCIPCLCMEDNGNVYKGYACKIDAWDAETECRPNQCHYYKLPCKTWPETKTVMFPAKGGNP